MVKDQSDSEKGNLLLPHRLLFLINSKVLYMHHPTDRITHTTAFVTPVVGGGGGGGGTELFPCPNPLKVQARPP